MNLQSWKTSKGRDSVKRPSQKCPGQTCLAFLVFARWVCSIIMATRSNHIADYLRCHSRSSSFINAEHPPVLLSLRVGRSLLGGGGRGGQGWGGRNKRTGLYQPMLSFRFSCVCLRLIRILLTGTHHPRPSILLYPLSSLRGREIGSPGKTLAEQTWDNPRASYSRICLFRLMQIFCWVGDMVIRIVPPFLTRLGTL